MSEQKEQNRIKEAQGRSLFQNYAQTHLTGITAINFIEDPFSSIDCYIVSGRSYCTCEIKTRDYKHNHFFSNKGWVLEKTKYDAMMKGADPSGETGERALYINIFNDALVVYDLTEMPLVFRSEWLREEHTSTKKVKKQVCYLPIKYASHIYLNKFSF